MAQIEFQARSAVRGNQMLGARLSKFWNSVADRGRKLLNRRTEAVPFEPIEGLAAELSSKRGEATNMARAVGLIAAYEHLSEDRRDAFHDYLAQNFLPDPVRLRAAAEAYLAAPSASTAHELGLASASPRRELIRRINVAPGATAALVRMRESLLTHAQERPHLAPLEQDLRHLFASWFNRGFLELRRIDWHTSASILEKVIAYEAVHEIRGWDDLRRRLAPDRRCFAFFHPALPEEPLIFVEVALCRGLATSIDPLLRVETPPERSDTADTAIFYSISNCQPGLRGISFGNFLIKQVVEELRTELPNLRQFATLSPAPGFRRWLQAHARGACLSEQDWEAIRPANEAARPTDISAATKGVLLRLLACYLTDRGNGGGPQDSVARFHLGNGARLERLNWAANMSNRGMSESLGMMVNYLYEPSMIESNHEQFVTVGKVAHSSEIAEILRRKLPQ